MFQLNHTNLQFRNISYQLLNAQEKILLYSKLPASYKSKLYLTTETVEGSALSLKGINNVKSSNSLSLGVLSVSCGVSDDVFEEALQNSSGIVVDVSGNTFNTTSSGKSSNSWLGDTFNAWLVCLSGVSFGADLTDTLTTFSLSDHLMSFDTNILFYI